MKVTLQVNGREMTFSEKELKAILEEHFSSETKQVITAKVSQKPTEDEWFEVKPQAIDQKLFEEKREDKEQENTRQLILEAFVEMKANPEIYGRNFKTMMPKHTAWYLGTGEYIHRLAHILGDHNANWVEQALEWAQRIANGESWETICNDEDTVRWRRFVVWKNGHASLCLVGGSERAPSSTYVISCNYNYDYVNLYDSVPLVVRYE